VRPDIFVQAGSPPRALEIDPLLLENGIHHMNAPSQFIITGKILKVCNDRNYLILIRIQADRHTHVLPSTVFRSGIDKIIVGRFKNFQQDLLTFPPTIHVIHYRCDSCSGVRKQA
jgi:hypothetical protein